MVGSQGDRLLDRVEIPPVDRTDDKFQVVETGHRWADGPDSHLF